MHSSEMTEGSTLQVYKKEYREDFPARFMGINMVGSNNGLITSKLALMSIYTSFLETFPSFLLPGLKYNQAIITPMCEAS